jgi:hypothetical protein
MSSSEPPDFENMLEQLIAEQSRLESITEGVVLDVRTEEFQHYNLVEQSLLNNGVSLKAEGLVDYFDYSDNLTENIREVTYLRMSSILTALGFLACEPNPLSQISQIDEDIIADLENVFLHEDENDLAWLNTLRDILPSALFLNLENDADLISNFRKRASIRQDVDLFDFRLRKNARALLTTFVIKENGEHDDNSAKVTRLVGGVIGIYGGEDPVVSDMLIKDASKTLESFGYTPDEALSLLKSIHDQSI